MRQSSRFSSPSRNIPVEAMNLRPFHCMGLWLAVTAIPPVRSPPLHRELDCGSRADPDFPSRESPGDQCGLDERERRTSRCSAVPPQ